MSVRSGLASFLLATASVVLTLVVFEVALRTVGAFGPSEDPGSSRTAQLFVVSENPEVAFELRPGAYIDYPAVAVGDRATAPWFVRVNADGSRSNGGADPSAPEIRGVCLGDSIMFGAGVSDDETIPARLSELVSKKLDRRFECVNFGVPNYTTVQEVALFRHKDALHLDPSIVIVGVYTNDFKTSLGRIDVLEDEARLVSPDATTSIAGAFRNLRLARLVGAALLGVRDWLRELGLYPQANGKPLEPAQIQAVYGALDDLRSLLEPRDIPLMLILFPRDWQLNAPNRAAATERQRVAMEYCRKHGIRCVDLLDHFYGRAVEDYFRPGDDSHPHAEAAGVSAGLAADAVFEVLAPRLKRPASEPPR